MTFTGKAFAVKKNRKLGPRHTQQDRCIHFHQKNWRSATVTRQRQTRRIALIQKQTNVVY